MVGRYDSRTEIPKGITHGSIAKPLFSSSLQPSRCFLSFTPIDRTTCAAIYLRFNYSIGIAGLVSPRRASQHISTTCVSHLRQSLNLEPRSRLVQRVYLRWVYMIPINREHDLRFTNRHPTYDCSDCFPPQPQDCLEAVSCRLLEHACNRPSPRSDVGSYKTANDVESRVWRPCTRETVDSFIHSQRGDIR